MTAEQTIATIRAALAAYDAAQAPPTFIIVILRDAVTATKTTKAKALKPAAKRKRATPGRHQFETFVPRSSS